MSPHRLPQSIASVEAKIGRLSIFIYLAFAVITGRLFYIQILEHPGYRDLSDANSLRLIPERAPRGLIVDRKGVILASNVPTYSLFIVPADVQTHGPTLQRLSRFLEEPLPVLEEMVASRKSRRRYEPIRLRTHLTEDLVARIEENKANLPGVYIQMEPERHYPQGKRACHVLGYIGEISDEELTRLRPSGYNPGDLVGKRGVEKIYDSFLRGEPGGFQVEVNPSGIQRRTVRYRAPLSGKTIKLSIDFDIQILAEELLGNLPGAVVVCNPKNGEVLALASTPGYDPNLFVGGISVKNWNMLLSDEMKPMQNRTLQGQYPPGSVFKIVTALAALQDGIIDPERLFLCRGIYWYKTWPYRCWKTFGHGWMNLHNALVGSCDIYFYQVGLELKVDKLYRAARSFGLGSRTHIDLDSEMAGLVPNAKWKEATQHMPWFPGNTIQMSFGQGYLLTTPLQMLSVTCAMANRGRVFQPHLLYQVLDDKTGQPRQAYRPTVMLETVFDLANIDRVRSSLQAVVGSVGGTGKKARITGLQVAGKTGTSENPHGENHAWFTAYAPAEEPRVAVIVLVENGGEGGVVAAPIAKRLIEASLGREVTPWASPTPVPPGFEDEGPQSIPTTSEDVP